MHTLASISWDLSPVTGDLSNLGTSLIEAGALGIAAAMLLFGLQKAVAFVLRIFKDVESGGATGDDPLATMTDADWRQDWENQEAALDGRASRVEADYLPRNNVGRKL